MRILVVGAGGREHALAYKLSQSPDVSKVIAAPGNGGTALCGENVAVSDTDVPGLVALARDRGVDMVVAGPEAPLVSGLRDAMESAGVACFGPDAYASGLEGSKAFAKEVMNAAGVPTAAHETFTDFRAAKAFIEKKGAPLVIKADGPGRRQGRDRGQNHGRSPGSPGGGHGPGCLRRGRRHGGGGRGAFRGGSLVPGLLRRHPGRAHDRLPGPQARL